jgi:threonine synthase
MVAVQAAGCSPVAHAFEAGAEVSELWKNARTFASGLRVPKPYGDGVMLKILRESEGIAVTVTDEEILGSILDWARNEGVFSRPRERRVRRLMIVCFDQGL